MEKKELTARRIPCLDGIRAISISLVLVAHMTGTSNFRIPKGVAHLLDMGNLGVRVFFVISGFLITSLLVTEYQKTDSISLVKFYFNRTFRIFPAFYVYVLAIMAANSLDIVSLKPGDIFHAVTYTMNYYHDRPWELGHIWSLSVEEQFYIIWPAVFLLAGRKGASFVAAGYILVGPVVRVIVWKFFPGHIDSVGESFETIADSIATGCILTFVRQKLECNDFYMKCQQRGSTLALLVGTILFLNFNGGSISVMYPVGQTIMNFAIAMSVDWCLRNYNSRVGVVLNNRLLVWIGTLSYSLYLWQQMFLNRNGMLLINRTPYNLVFALLAAVASYYFVEVPFLKIRSWLAKKVFAKAEVLIPVATTEESMTS